VSGHDAVQPGAPDLAVELCGVRLRNPILLASGACGYGSELEPFLDLSSIGGLVAKSLTLEPRVGNPPVRIAETPSGMLNAISLENVGVDRFVREKLPALAGKLPVFASVFETELERYAEVCKRLDGAPVAGLELNASCPHVKAGGMEFGQDPKVLASLVRACRSATRLPLLVKLSPNVTSIAEMARVCEGEGADGVSLINTLQALVVDVEKRRPVLSNGFGGLSGPAIRPVALRMVFQVARAVRIPICGMGGIATGEDAVAFLLCGATAVQVGTASYARPDAAAAIRDGLAAYLTRHAEHGFRSARDLVGKLEAPAR
jgi:dihydroorotate dehydrogenase (NAD+) catalytic subunit